MNTEIDTQPNEDNFKKEMKTEILKSFHSQFSENQNFQQKLFLQFLSAIIIVGIPFGIVLVKTTNQADLWEIKPSDDKKEIISYAIIHLIEAWALVQIALIMLSAFVLSIAYSFRRDQKVVVEIRKKVLGETYNDIFSDKSFSALNKDWKGAKSYVPLFCALFWQFAVWMQCITSIVLGLRIFNLTNPSRWVILEVVGFLFVISVAISYFWRYYYYLKYKIYVEGKPKKYQYKIDWFFYCFLGEKQEDK